MRALSAWGLFFSGLAFRTSLLAILVYASLAPRLSKTGASYISSHTVFETTLNQLNYHIGGGADLAVSNCLGIRFASGYSYQRLQGTESKGFQILAGPVPLWISLGVFGWPGLSRSR